MKRVKEKISVAERAVRANTPMWERRGGAAGDGKVIMLPGSEFVGQWLEVL